MRDKTLLTVSVVADDSTGLYEIGELDYGVPVETSDWLDADPGRRKLLADWLRMLATKVEAKKSPFQPA